MHRLILLSALCFVWASCLSPALQAQVKPAHLTLSPEMQDRCLQILREGFKSEEFWPSMHAAEGLTVAGYGAEVRQALPARIPTETDDQRKCGLARELVRAGDLPRTRLMLEILAGPDPHGHVHACESLFKVWQIGDGRLLRRSLTSDNPKQVMMAAAALARWGHPGALPLLRKYVQHADGEQARIAAWILARVGDVSDLPSLRAGAARFEEPLTRAYFQYATACLGDPAGQATLIANLSHADPAVRVYACEFAPDARALSAAPALTKLLDDEVLDVRIRAAQALLALAQEPAPAWTAEFSRDVFPATAEHPRYSEGSIAPLADGRLLYATTEFVGGGSDFATARIIGVESANGGRDWSAPRVLQETTGKQNVMSATLRRLSPTAVFDGPLGFFYLVKNSPQDLQVELRTSADEARSFGPPVRVTTTEGYHVLNNDRVTVLSTGRLVVPVASTGDVLKGGHFQCWCELSDDGGKTWRRSRRSVDYAKRGAMEPEVLELDSRKLLMHIRTQLGHIAVSESTDGGETWSEARPWDVRGPESPATLRRIPSTGDLLLIWNDTFTPGAGHGGKRTPLTAAVSTDEGKTWTFKRNLETDGGQTYAYTSVLFHEGRALLSYYVRDEKSGWISSRFRSLPIGWLYAARPQ